MQFLIMSEDGDRVRVFSDGTSNDMDAHIHMQ